VRLNISVSCPCAILTLPLPTFPAAGLLRKRLRLVRT
jgi:hypothetical protein